MKRKIIPSFLRNNSELYVTDEMLKITGFDTNNMLGIFEEGNALVIKQQTEGCQRRAWFVQEENNNNYLHIGADVTRPKGIAAKAIAFNEADGGRVIKRIILDPNRDINVIVCAGKSMIPLNPQQAKRKIEYVRGQDELRRVVIPLHMSIVAGIDKGYDRRLVENEIVLKKGGDACELLPNHPRERSSNWCSIKTMYKITADKDGVCLSTNGVDQLYLIN